MESVENYAQLLYAQHIEFRRDDMLPCGRCIGGGVAMTKFTSKIKPIETKYNGYKFRSRLEARYAVFFDHLGIKYYYEHEGYSLEGIPYLPDFYLPEHNCFIEIKGVEPTEVELEKAKLLATYTGTPVYLFAGNISLPCEEMDLGECWTYSYHPPKLWKYPSHETLGEGQTIAVSIAHDLLGLMQRAEDLNLALSLDDVGQITFNVTDITWYNDDLIHLLETIKQQQRFLETFQLTIDGREDEMRQALRSDEGWTHEVLSGAERSFEHWYECSHCSALLIGMSNLFSHPCRKIPVDSQLLDDSPRLIAAYEAARQARFK